MPSRLVPPPVLVLPGLLTPDECWAIIDAAKATTPRSSGFMWPGQDGKPVETLREDIKVREDFEVSPTDIWPVLMQIEHTVQVAIEQVFRSRVTHFERSLVARYGVGGHFRPHMDDLLPGTEHRKFAMTLQLNQPGDYSGGVLAFPRYITGDADGDEVPYLQQGDAVVFSCGLEHGVTPVTRGERWAFLTFLYEVKA